MAPNNTNPDYFIRELAREDVKLINQWRMNRHVVDSLGTTFRHVSAEIDERWFDGYLSSRPNNVRLAICRITDIRIVGAVYLLNIDWVARTAEFSIWIGDVDAQGRGAGRAGSLAALRHAFYDLGLLRVELRVLVRNERAIRLYEHLGFQREGLLRAAAFKNGRAENMLIMGLLADDFQTIENI